MNKMRLWVRGLKMLIAGIVNIFIGLFLGIYSGLSLYFPLMTLMTSRLFRWIPISRFYANASAAMARLEIMSPLDRGYYDDAFAVPKREIGMITKGDRGFRELSTAIMQAGLVRESITSIVMERSVSVGVDAGVSENEKLVLKILRESGNSTEISEKPKDMLALAIEKAAQKRVAILTLVLTAILFALGIVLIAFAIRSQE